MQGAIAERKTLYAACALAFLSLLVHAAPFVLYGPHPLGYDTGFYRRYLTQPFQSIPNAPVPGLGDDAFLPRLLLDLLRLTHLPTDVILYGSYIALFALLPILLYFFLRPTLGARGAFIAGCLIVASPVLYNAYWYMLFKNAFALNLLLLACMALERRKIALVVLLDIAIVFSHTTSAVVYGSVLGLLFIIWPGRRLEMMGHGLLTVACFALVNISRVHQASLALPTALFIEWPQYVWLSVPLLLLIVCGWRGMDPQRMPRTLIALAMASFAFPILHLPFYQRIFVFSDVALVALAVYATDYLLSRIDIRDLTPKMYAQAATLCIAIGLLLGNLYNQINSVRPLLPQSSITAIQSVGEFVPENAFILTTAAEAPWYEGWTLAHIAAPGLLHDTHNLEAWEALWSATSSAQQIAFLASFPQPLYISTTGPFHELLGTPAPCLELIAPNLLLDACQKIQ